MAKPKGKDIVGWTNMPGSSAGWVSIVAEKDVDQKARRKAGGRETWSRGHTVRQLGLARWDWPAGPTYSLYSHSQVSNGGGYRLYEPPTYVGMNKEDLEWLVAVLLRELYGDKPAAE